jgi:FHS family L-fucose permease-like MFS transporter
LIVMAIVGGAILTPLMGLIAEARHTIAPAYFVPLAAYVVIAGYAFLGAQARGVADTAGHQFPS